jgi:DNA replication protein DnaC
MSPRQAVALDADLEAGLKRLKLAAVRRMAPEVLQTAKVQRWAPDELLRTLVEAEIAARDASNERARRKAAGFPVSRRLEDFVLAESSVPRATFDHLASLDWIEAAENVVLVGPAGTGKSHILLGIGEAAVVRGRRVRYLPAASLVETLYGGLADNSVGRVIERLLRHELIIIDDLGFAPLDDTGSDLLFRFVAAAYEHRSLGVASHWPFESWGRFLPEHTTAVAMLDRLLHHATTVVTSGDSYRMKEARQRGGGLQATS